MDGINPNKFDNELSISNGRESVSKSGGGPWCPRQESNLYLALRRRSFYPLNYGGKGTSLRSMLVVRLLDHGDAHAALTYA